MALAEELLAAAARSSNPAALIEAARALVAEASGTQRSAAQNDQDAASRVG